MSDRTDPESLLAELRGLHETMTPGPWRHGFDDGSGKSDGDAGGWIVGPGTGNAAPMVVRGGRDEWACSIGVAEPHDGDGIARLRSLLPQIIESLARPAAPAGETRRNLGTAEWSRPPFRVKRNGSAGWLVLNAQGGHVAEFVMEAHANLFAETMNLPPRPEYVPPLPQPQERP